jgi:hypothetical protein
MITVMTDAAAVEIANASADGEDLWLSPDFALPDLAGVSHTLAAHRGKKALLVSWASW